MGSRSARSHNVTELAHLDLDNEGVRHRSPNLLSSRHRSLDRSVRDKLSDIVYPARSRPAAAPVEQEGMDERSLRYERAFELPILVAALLVIPVIAIEQSEAGEPWRAIAALLNWAIWIAFALEVVVMLAVVPDRRRWLRGHPLELVVVVLTPPFLPASLQALRALRILRLLRLIRVAPLVRRLFSLDGLRYAAILAGLTSATGTSTQSPSVGDCSRWRSWSSASGSSPS
jgi:hypothetical protein